MKFNLAGLVAAPFTPFAPNGDLALEVVPRLARTLAGNGVSGAFICGTTGEGASMPSGERRQVAEAKTKIPTLAGIKFTYEDLDDYAAARAIGGRDYEVLFGRDENLLTGLGLGAKGAVGSTYNYAAPLYHRIIRAHAAGDTVTAE